MEISKWDVLGDLKYLLTYLFSPQNLMADYFPKMNLLEIESGWLKAKIFYLIANIFFFAESSRVVDS